MIKIPAGSNAVMVALFYVSFSFAVIMMSLPWLSVPSSVWLTILGIGLAFLQEERRPTFRHMILFAFFILTPFHSLLAS